MSELSAPLVGMRYRPPALTILAGLGFDQPLILRREPGNEYDENAIAVYMPEGWGKEELQELWTEAEAEAQSLGKELDRYNTMLGYCAREVAKDWAPILDQLSVDDTDWPPARLTFGPNGSPQVTIDLPGQDELTDNNDTDGTAD